MVIFSLIFGTLAGLPSEGVPYPIFTYVALLPWQFFANATLNDKYPFKEMNSSQLLE